MDASSCRQMYHFLVRTFSSTSLSGSAYGSSPSKKFLARSRYISAPTLLMVPPSRRQDCGDTFVCSCFEYPSCFSVCDVNFLYSFRGRRLSSLTSLRCCILASLIYLSAPNWIGFLERNTEIPLRRRVRSGSWGMSWGLPWATADMAVPSLR